MTRANPNIAEVAPDETPECPECGGGDVRWVRAEWEIGAVVWPAHWECQDCGKCFKEEL